MIREARLGKEDTLVAPIPGPIGACISLRAAGDMGPSGGSNLRRDEWLVRHGLTPELTALRSQTHSRRVDIVERDTVAARSIEADGMLSADQRIALAVTVADCMPIFLYDRAHGVRGILHSGWEGTGIAAVALDLLRARWGSISTEIEVVLGPCIGACCYRVDEARAATFADRWGAAAVRRCSDGIPFLDLRAANIGMMRERGIERITVVTDCTVCSSRLGSFRREGAEAFTRMLAVTRGRG